MFCTKSVLIVVFLFVIYTVVNGEEAKPCRPRSCARNQTCVPMSSCTTHNHNFTSLSERDRQFYAKCDCTATEPTVCCPQHISETDTPDKHVCGQIADQDKIFNGYNVEIEDYRWMALLQYQNPNTKEISYHCAGSLINNRYVLTAAHCLTNNDELTHVHLGKYYSNIYENCYNDRCAHPTVTVGIENKTIHPDYDGKTNDIGLIRLSSIIYYTDFIQPICLPWTLGLTSSPDTTSCEIAGWGKGAANSGKQRLDIPIYNFIACAETYRQRSNMRIDDETQLCAGGMPNRGACAGDSGGPLMVELNETYAIEGIISSGYNICDEDKNTSYPIIFTKVSAFESWIKKEILP